MLDHADAPNDIWAFGVVRREAILGPGAVVYFDGFGRVRRIRVCLDAPKGWRRRLTATNECLDTELRVAEQVERIVDSFELPVRSASNLRRGAPRSLEGRFALVTGASRGIGAAVAQRLAGADATVICVARTLEGHPAPTGEVIDTTLADTIAAIRAQGDVGEPLLADLGDPVAVDA